MADGLLIQIGADVSGAIRDIPKVSKSLAQVEDQFAGLVGTTGDFGKAIDELGKDGALSISFLQKQITDFGKAFADATDPEDIKKFGAALEILKVKQQQLINSALPDQLDKVSHSAGGGAVASQRLSSSLLGLSNHLGVLPPELAGLTHGFDQLIQGFERVTHGTEGAGDKVLKFAGVLGEVGLGLAISVAIGLLVDLGKELFTTGDAFSKAEIDAAKFKSELEDVDNQIKLLGKNTELATQIAKLRAQIKLGSGTEANILGDKAEIENNVKLIERLDAQLDDIQKQFGALTKAAPFQKLGEGAKQLLDESSLVAGVPELFPKDLISKLKGHDKEFIEEIESVNKLIHDLQTQREDIQNKNRLTELQIELERSKDGKKANKDYANLLKERQQILEEFTAKFATIKLPLPILDSQLKNIKVTKVNNKLLRDFLQGTLSVFDKEFKNLATGAIDPKTIPVEIKFAPLFKNRTQLVTQIEEKFGEISKEVENAVNKGIFEVPIEFRTAPEGDGLALKHTEDLANDFIKQIESLTGQKNAILTIPAEFLAHLDQKKFDDTIDDIKKQIQLFGGDPVKVTKNLEVKIDAEKVVTQLSVQVREALKTFTEESFANIGNVIGDAISGLDLKNSFQAFAQILSNGLASVGKAMIAAGAKILIAKVAIGKLFQNPALSIAAGVALIALSRIISNSINTNGRALGGPVHKGLSYVVNERGREIFQPNRGQARWIEGGMQTFTPESSGKIIPASLAKAMAGSLNVKGLEAGGLVSSPTFALIGEGAGISRSNPEVVAPLSELRGMLGLGSESNINVNIDSMVRGKNLTRVIKRQERSNQRLT